LLHQNFFYWNFCALDFFYKKNYLFLVKNYLFGVQIDLIKTSFNKVRLFKHVIMLKHLSKMSFFQIFWGILKGNSEGEFWRGFPKGNSHWIFSEFQQNVSIIFLESQIWPTYRLNFQTLKEVLETRHLGENGNKT